VLVVEVFRFGAMFTIWLVFIRWVANLAKNTALGPALAYISH
jgi:hypothetical protein